MVFSEEWFQEHKRKLARQGLVVQDPFNTASPARSVVPEPSAPKRSKYGNRKVSFDGYTFDSQLEAARYLQLVYQEKAGEVLWFLTQVPIRFPEKVTYWCDFFVLYADGHHQWEDTKGRETDVFKMKMKLLRHHYPHIHVHLTTKDDIPKEWREVAQHQAELQQLEELKGE